MIRELLQRLETEQENIYIQTHNFPDPDAVASAYGLQQLLKINGIKSRIIYDGVIQRTALSNMIKDFSIDIHQSGDYLLSKKDKIIIVDGCKRNKNVTDLIGEEIAVIDHHPGKEPEDVEFVDIYPEVGACASIITSYFIELNFRIPVNVATVLLTGLFRDTDCMTRGVCPMDVQAYTELFKTADNFKVNSIVLNNITLADLNYYTRVIRDLKTEGDIAFCYIKEECNQNLLGILGDFLLSLEEIRFTALFADNHNVINISFRNESVEINAAEVMKTIVSGIGSGGGHKQMAGGVIDSKVDFNPEAMFNKIITLIQ
ncbi:MAG: DHH family phosphoesterase [Spirochaetaceae bacterium]|nr:DHH family phosphoesterase [Spirochaetaceae bacterium]